MLNELHTEQLSFYSPFVGTPIQLRYRVSFLDMYVFPLAGRPINTMTVGELVMYDAHAMKTHIIPVSVQDKPVWCCSQLIRFKLLTAAHSSDFSCLEISDVHEDFTEGMKLSCCLLTSFPFNYAWESLEAFIPIYPPCILFLYYLFIFRTCIHFYIAMKCFSNFVIM